MALNLSSAALAFSSGVAKGYNDEVEAVRNQRDKINSLKLLLEGERYKTRVKNWEEKKQIWDSLEPVRAGRIKGPEAVDFISSIIDPKGQNRSTLDSMYTSDSLHELINVYKPGPEPTFTDSSNGVLYSPKDSPFIMSKDITGKEVTSLEGYHSGTLSQYANIPKLNDGRPVPTNYEDWETRSGPRGSIVRINKKTNEVRTLVEGQSEGSIRAPTSYEQRRQAAMDLFNADQVINSPNSSPEAIAQATAVKKAANSMLGDTNKQPEKTPEEKQAEQIKTELDFMNTADSIINGEGTKSTVKVGNKAVEIPLLSPSQSEALVRLQASKLKKPGNTYENVSSSFNKEWELVDVPSGLTSWIRSNNVYEDGVTKIYIPRGWTYDEFINRYDEIKEDNPEFSEEEILESLTP